MNDEEEKKRLRVEKLDRLTDLILDDLLAQAENQTLTSADRKLILDFLVRNGLNLDPSSIPQDIKGLLTSRVAFDDSDEKPKLRVG